MQDKTPKPHRTLQSFTHILAEPRHLYRPAHAAIRRSDFSDFFLDSRQAETCSEGETPCEVGGWCCGNGDTCSFEQNAFFCCPVEAGPGGCARVCAAGDFQCGSICCANGQTCMGADSAAPFCMDGAPSTSLTLPTTPVTLTTLSTIATTSSLSSTSTPEITSASATSTGSTLFLAPSSSFSSSHHHHHHPSSPASDDVNSPAATSSAPGPATGSSSGLPPSAQIAIGIIVPVVVISLVLLLWIIIFRKKSAKNDPDQGNDPNHPDGPYTSHKGGSSNNQNRNSDASFYSSAAAPAYGYHSEKNRTLTVMATVNQDDDESCYSNVSRSPSQSTIPPGGRARARRSEDLFEMVTLDEATGTHVPVARGSRNGNGNGNSPKIGLTIDTEKAERERRDRQRDATAGHLHQPSLDAGEVSPTSVLPLPGRAL